MLSDQPSLSLLIGERIFIKMPLFKGNAVITVLLIGVETGGIWVESNDFMEAMFEGTEHKMSPRSMQIFVPYAQILAIYYPGGGPWISEKVTE
jgi:hypothetical protein